MTDTENKSNSGREIFRFERTDIRNNQENYYRMIDQENGWLLFKSTGMDNFSFQLRSGKLVSFFMSFIEYKGGQNLLNSFLNALISFTEDEIKETNDNKKYN